MQNMSQEFFKDRSVFSHMEGRAEGRAEGERLKTEEIARNLKVNGVPTDVIAKTTGLSEEEIALL